MAALPKLAWHSPHVYVQQLLGLLLCWSRAVWQLLSGASAMLAITWCVPGCSGSPYAPGAQQQSFQDPL